MTKKGNTHRGWVFTTGCFGCVSEEYELNPVLPVTLSTRKYRTDSGFPFMRDPITIQMRMPTPDTMKNRNRQRKPRMTLSRNERFFFPSR